MYRLVILLAFAFYLALPASPAQAQSCTVDITDTNFGSVDTLAGSAADTTATATITCTSTPSTFGVYGCLYLEAGTGGATSGVRHMSSGANQLDYSLYQDAARSIPWGSPNNPSLGDAVAFETPIGGGNTTMTATVYGRIFGGQQGAATGSYSSSFSGTDAAFWYIPYNDSFPHSSDCTSLEQRDTTSFTVLAEVEPNCLVTAQDIDFGNQGILAADLAATGAVDVSCSSGLAYTVALDNGLSGSGPTSRLMTQGAEAVTYGLYQDSAHSQPWGATGGELVSGTGTGTAQNIPVHAEVPAQTTPSPGTYTDTVVVTVAY